MIKTSAEIEIESANRTRREFRRTNVRTFSIDGRVHLACTSSWMVFSYGKRSFDRDRLAKEKKRFLSFSSGNNSKTSGAKDRDKTRFRHTGIEKENVRGKPDRIRNLFRSIKRHCIRGAGSDIGTKPRLTILRPLQNDVRPLSSSRARSFINYISLPPPPPIIN